jgi:hypothetical protein
MAPLMELVGQIKAQAYIKATLLLKTESKYVEVRYISK